MQDAISYIVTNIDSLATAALAIVGACSAVAAIFGKQDNKWLEYTRKAINLIALNVGKAKNKE